MSEATANINIEATAMVGDAVDSMGELNDSLQETKEAAEEAAMAAEEMGDAASGPGAAGLRGLTPTLAMINPNLARYASAAFGAMKVTKKFGLSMASIGIYLAAAAAAVAVLYAAYYVLSARTREAAKATEALALSQEALNVAHQAGAVIRTENLRLLGEITEAEFRRMQQAQQTGDIFTEQGKQFQRQLIETADTLGEQVEKVDKLRGIWSRLSQVLDISGINLLTTQGRLHVLDAQIDGSRTVLAGYTQDWMSLVGEISAYREQIELNAALKDPFEFVGPLPFEEIATGADAAGDGVEDLTKQTATYIDQQKYLLELGIKGRLQDAEKIAAIRAEVAAIEDGSRATEAAAASEIQRRDDSITAAGNAIAAAGLLTDAIGTNAQKSFAINQALALADITVNTASAIMKAAAVSANPILIASMAALGVAQAAAVMAAQPPQAAHMGGVATRDPLAPDEGLSRRILSGETILDRATTNRIGQAGIRSMMQGGGGDQAVRIVVPYKHLDREIGRLGRNDSRSSRTMRRAAIISTGQLGW